MTKLETAFQEYDIPNLHHESQFRFKKPIYIARHNPYMLARAFMDSGRQVLLKHDHQPTSVLVDLPCTLFMMDNRNLTVVEDMAKLLSFSPTMTVRGCPLATPATSTQAHAALIRLVTPVAARPARDAALLVGPAHDWSCLGCKSCPALSLTAD